MDLVLLGELHACYLSSSPPGAADIKFLEIFVGRSLDNAWRLRSDLVDH